ncbi:MAG: TatD DNase family protein [Chthoniobacter sp.]|jgi:TatD DNase family protein|nr:TatD DNase family protein [Chthoniobacter sp.]
MLIDTHAHLDFPEFAGELEQVLARAAAAGVTRIITIGTTLEGSRRAVALAERFPNVFATVGVHPSNAGEAPGDFIATLRELAQNPRVVAIGECGLDYHRLPSLRIQKNDPALEAFGNESPADLDAALADGAVKSAQAEVFEAQLDLAAELGMNVIVHQRDSWADTLALLRSSAGRLRAVFHCFGGGLDQAREVFALGHLVSFTGIVTFKNAAQVQQCAARIGTGDFMVETDAPYLAPVPHRGQRCEPAHTRLVAEKLCALRGEPLADLAAHTTATAEAFFRFPR